MTKRWNKETREQAVRLVLVKEAVQAFLEERWIHALERTVQTTDARRGYRAGYYQRNLITPIGTIELRVLRD